MEKRRPKEKQVRVTEERDTIRLNKFIAMHGGCSRREADRLIQDGRVSINGKTVTEMGMQVDPASDKVTIDGEGMGSDEKVYYAFHKPAGYLTSYGDPEGRPNLNDFPFIAANKLPYSGRLDLDSEGLILFTNDGELVYRLQRREYKVEKEYRIIVNRELTEAQIEEMESGLIIQEDGTQLLPCVVHHAGLNRYIVIITEGKKRQVRMMFRQFGIRVKRLFRVRIGTIQIGELPPGEHRKLTKKEIMELKNSVSS